jgi:hypothetical protein
VNLGNFDADFRVKLAKIHFGDRLERDVSSGAVAVSE